MQCLSLTGDVISWSGACVQFQKPYHEKTAAVLHFILVRSFFYRCLKDSMHPIPC